MEKWDWRGDEILTSDQEKARLQRLQQDDTLSPVNTSQQDENSTRLQRFTDLGSSNLLADLGLGLSTKNI